MSAFTEFWSQLSQPGQPAPYMLIDCAGVEGGAERLPRDIFDEFECLFTGDLAEELEDVAPYLGRLGSLGPEAQAVVEDLLARHLGILVTLPLPAGSDEPPSFSQVHRHFRKFNVVYGPEGKPLFFRYYDPRVIVDVLKVLDEQQLKAFFGPVDRMLLTQADGVLVNCAAAGGKLLVTG
jgi:hypothetical protein